MLRLLTVRHLSKLAADSAKLTPEQELANSKSR